jgi:hypothetical protein
MPNIREKIIAPLLERKYASSKPGFMNLFET